jgi:hypothetical protein
MSAEKEAVAQPAVEVLDRRTGADMENFAGRFDGNLELGGQDRQERLPI